VVSVQFRWYYLMASRYKQIVYTGLLQRFEFHQPDRNKTHGSIIFSICDRMIFFTTKGLAFEKMFEVSLLVFWSRVVRLSVRIFCFLKARKSFLA